MPLNSPSIIPNDSVNFDNLLIELDGSSYTQKIAADTKSKNYKDENELLVETLSDVITGDCVFFHEDFAIKSDARYENKPADAVALTDGKAGDIVRFAQTNRIVAVDTAISVGKDIYLGYGSPNITTDLPDKKLFQKIGERLNANSFILKINPAYIRVYT